MLGHLIYHTLMFFIIWDIYLRLGGKNTDLKHRLLFLLCDLVLAVWGQVITRYYQINLPLVPFVTLSFSYYLNKVAIPAERFFLGFYPVVLVDIARRFLATFFFPPILGLTAYTLETHIWWSLIPLAFVLPTVHLVDFILRLDFADIQKVPTNHQKKRRLGLVNLFLLVYYSLFFVVGTFDTFFPELYLVTNLRLPMVLGYLYLLLFVLGTVNQFAKQKIDQDLSLEQVKYLNHLKRENARVESLYKDLLQVRSNYNLLLNSLREVERTGDIRASKKDLIGLYVHQSQDKVSTKIEELTNVRNPNIYSLLTSKYHEAQMYGITIHAEIPNPITTLYLTELDLAVLFGHLMDKAIEASKEVKDGFIHLAYFEDQDSQSFIIEHAMEPDDVTGPLRWTNNELGRDDSVAILQEVLERYPNISFSTRSHHHKVMHILEMRP